MCVNISKPDTWLYSACESSPVAGQLFPRVPKVENHTLMTGLAYRNTHKHA